MKTKIRVSAGLVMIMIAGFCAFEFWNATTPTIRATPAHPIYTIGERSTYSAALASGASVLKFGPMFFGLYPGGLAFETPEGAKAYLKENGWDRDRWSVYRLSGDFAHDSEDGHINTSLLVLEETP